MKKSLILAAVLAVAVSSVSASPLIWRGASTLKPMQLMVLVPNGYMQTARGYDWDNSEWKDLADDKKTTVIKFLPMVGLGLFKGLELGVVAPLYSKSKGDHSSLGLGDAWLKARYGVLKGKLTPVKLTLSVAAILPTAPEDANPSLGDRTLDFGFGAIAQTQKLAGFIGHLRLGYWLNGKYTKTVEEVEKEYDVGNMFEYVVKVDYKFNKKTGVFLSVGGMMLAETKVDGVTNAKSAKDRHEAWFGAIWKPIPKLAIRPKVGVPLEFACKGGSLQPFDIGLDFWVTLP